MKPFINENKLSLSVAIPDTVDGNGIAEAISVELDNLGHQPFLFPLGDEIPQGMDVVLLFGPFGKFLHVPRYFDSLPVQERPVFVYWNTEGMPDLRLSRALVRLVSGTRSWLGRMDTSSHHLVRHAANRGPLRKLETRLLRFRYLGDYLYARQMGWIDVFADISAVYAGYLRSFGIPASVAPFGSFPGWYADLELERDIDVLWMGKRATRRRSEALHRVREDLKARGVNMLVVDNKENPFVFHDERTRLLNRTKITLNLLRTWYDENSLRICLAAPNRSLVVSEPLLPHVPQYQAGKHYVSSPIHSMADRIVEYLQNEPARQEIVENAYQLLTHQLTWRSTMQRLMTAAVDIHSQRKNLTWGYSLRNQYPAVENLISRTGSE